MQEEQEHQTKAISETSVSADKIPQFNEYYKLTDIVLKASLDELKLRAIDRRNMQDAKIRQLIYLCFTLSAAICTVIMMTPFWSGKAALLHSATTWHLFFLGLQG